MKYLKYKEVKFKTPVETERLILRRWQKSDHQPCIRMNSDPHVMKYFAAPSTPDETMAMLKRLETNFENDGFSFWAVEHKKTGAFMGMLGLGIPNYELPFSPCVEIGWRLLPDFWGQGYATEGARYALHYGFNILELEEIVSQCAAGNHASYKVMEKIGMHRNPQEDFDHPKFSTQAPNRRHVLYRLTRAEYLVKSYTGI